MEKKPDIKQRNMPRGKTALLQHLQNLVVQGNRFWIGGAISFEKSASLESLIHKLDERYRTHRDERGRIYDRARGRASCHLVLDVGINAVRWWVLSSEGKGGLADPASYDFKQARDAKSKDGHITVGPYVLTYAHKKDARKLVDARTGKEKIVFKSISTFTWSMTPEAFSASRADLQNEVKRGRLGTDTSPGLRRFLAMERKRPLFSGVRSQVLELHREALERWKASPYGKVNDLPTLAELMHSQLPKMRRIPIYRAGWTVQAIVEEARLRTEST